MTNQTRLEWAEVLEAVLASRNWNTEITAFARGLILGLRS